MREVHSIRVAVHLLMQHFPGIISLAQLVVQARQRFDHFWVTRSGCGKLLEGS